MEPYHTLFSYKYTYVPFLMSAFSLLNVASHPTPKLTNYNMNIFSVIVVVVVYSEREEIDNKIFIGTIAVAIQDVSLDGEIFM